MNVEASTMIARPPAEVFAFVSDARNEPQWHTDILEASLTGDGEVGKGSFFEVRIKPSMGVSGGTGELLEYRPDEKAVFHWKTGKIESDLTHEVTPDGGRHALQPIDHVDFPVPDASGQPADPPDDPQGPNRLPGQPQAGTRDLAGARPTGWC